MIIDGAASVYDSLSNISAGVLSDSFSSNSERSQQARNSRDAVEASALFAKLQAAGFAS